MSGSPPTLPIVGFETEAELWAWLEANHRTSPGVWVRLGKARGGLASVDFHQLLTAGLAYGWSESTRRGHDERSYLQRFTPRRRPGTVSPRNLEIVARLEREGRLTRAGRLAIGMPAEHA